MIKLWCIFKCKQCNIDIQAHAVVYIIEKKYVLIAVLCPICNKDTLFARTVHEFDELLKEYERRNFIPIKIEEVTA